MPIVRRTSLPPPTPARDPEFRLPGRPLYEVLAEKKREASDLAWSGKTAEADKVEAEITEIRKRLDAGELYEVTF